MHIPQEIQKSWDKARSFPGEIILNQPGKISSYSAAQTMIHLLQNTYKNHAISHSPNQLARDIESGKVEPWIVTRNTIPVACAALINNEDGTQEVGRAVSIERGSGTGKLAMLSAANSAKPDSLVAEVRLASEFAGVASSDATQRISFGILELVPHAIIPAFAHGEPLRNEIFAFSAQDRKSRPQTITETTLKTLAGRDVKGPLKRISTIFTSPFHLATPSQEGIELTEFMRDSRERSIGCTMVSAEATDDNLSTIAWLREHDFILSGLDRKLGQNGLPIVLLATLGRKTILAPVKMAGNLAKPLERDIQGIANNFIQLVRS